MSTISGVLQPFGLSLVTDGIKKLKAVPDMARALQAKGTQLAHAVAEHVLVCYRSRDAAFPLDVVTSGPVEETVEAAGADASLQEAAKAVASRFHQHDGGEE
jgi:hypothetical protein